MDSLLGTLQPSAICSPNTVASSVRGTTHRPLFCARMCMLLQLSMEPAGPVQGHVCAVWKHRAKGRMVRPLLRGSQDLVKRSSLTPSHVEPLRSQWSVWYV